MAMVGDTILYHRFMVRVTCNKCGEKYILRGTLDKNGHIETGFKSCVCDSHDVTTTIIQSK